MELIIKYYDGRLRNLDENANDGTNIDEIESKERIVETTELENESADEVE